MFSGMNYVYEVYKERSFSKAAENLYISQPALSAMIKKVENKVGMPLFRRCTPFGGHLKAWLNLYDPENCHATPIIPCPPA